MKKIKGRISFLVDRDETRIQIEDDNANVTIVRVRLTPEQLSMIFSRQAYVECELEVDASKLSKVGLTHQNHEFEFEIPEELGGWNSRDVDTIHILAQKAAPAGWIPDKYYNSQNSFFKGKDGKQYARTTIRRWIETKL